MGKVLLVDDSQEFLETLRSSLELAGFKVDTARNAVEALAYIKRHGKQVDCVLADYNMPEMRGDELAAIIKNKIGIPVIVMSGDPHAPVAKLFKSGVSGILNKPFNSEDFIEFLKNNDLHIENEQIKQRKFLRRCTVEQSPKIMVTNGRQSVWGEILNLSSGGVGIRLLGDIQSISTLEFRMEHNGEVVEGFMHCRWEAKVGETTKAGFEFDSLTKKALATNSSFARWINLSKTQPAS